MTLPQPTNESKLSPNGPAVSVDHVSKTYPVPFLRVKKLLRRKVKTPVEALRDVSLTISEGEIFGLIGPNGAGKTTLTKIIATLIQPTSGLAAVKGHDTVRDDERVRLNVGLANAEERSFYWRLTAEQNLMFFARLYGMSGPEARRRMKGLFEMFEFEELARRRFAELSTGNKQRLGIARAMLPRPPVLLLDEPTRSLDPIAAARMRSTIKSLASDREQRVTIFLTSHNLAEVEELCDRVAIISKGRIRALDTPHNLRAAHTQGERVSIAFGTNVADEIDQALRQAFTEHSFTLERISGSADWLMKFSREANDDLLDRVLRLLHQCGASISAIETERATLLDVLEGFEAEANKREDT